MDFLKEYLDKAREFFEGLDRNKKIAVGGGAGLLVVMLFFLTMSGGEQEVQMLPLYTDIDLKEAGQLAARLRELNQSFEIGGDGSIIMVPATDRLNLRNALAGEGFPKTGYIGYEVFDDVPLGMTDFLQQVKLRQALEGELKKTISVIEAIEDVRVQVVQPEPSLFTTEQKPATASILLKLRQNMKLDRQQVEGIQRMVASSVEGLEPNRITVIDQAGRLLSEEIDPLAEVTSKQLEMQRNVEAYLEERAQSTLDKVLGPDQAFVRISVELDFDQTQEEVETFNPAQAVLRSEQRTEEQSAASGTKESTVSNWEVNTSIRRITGSVGGVKRLTVALMVNATKPRVGLEPGAEPVYDPRTPEDITQISNIVRGAVGVDQTRGDLLEVSSFEFATQDLKAAAQKEQKDAETTELITSVVLNVAKGIAIVVALLILRAIIGAIGRGVAREEEIAMEAQRELEEDDVGEELPETPHEIILGRIAQLISERPEDAAKLIRTMLIEEAQRTRAT